MQLCMYVSYHEIYSNQISQEKPIRHIHLLFARQEMSTLPPGVGSFSHKVVDSLPAAKV